MTVRTIRLEGHPIREDDAVTFLITERGYTRASAEERAGRSVTRDEKPHTLANFTRIRAREDREQREIAAEQQWKAERRDGGHIGW